MMKKLSAILIIIPVLMLSACQSQSENNSKAEQVQGSQKIEEVQSHGEPFSKGPTDAPGVKGPTAPPPQAQAVTKNENIRLTLPLKSE
jgi:ABC-type phosphate/phosphonate transport system substrate-binding protein